MYGVTDTIPEPLRDCMEMVDVSRYVAEEKVAIAERYLIPEAQSYSGLKLEQIAVTPDVLNIVVKSCCTKSGVRNLQKQIGNVFRKVAFKLVQKFSNAKESAEFYP